MNEVIETRDAAGPAAGREAVASAAKPAIGRNRRSRPVVRHLPGAVRRGSRHRRRHHHRAHRTFRLRGRQRFCAASTASTSVSATCAPKAPSRCTARTCTTPTWSSCKLRKQVGMVFQRPNPLPISIRENVLFGYDLHCARRRGVEERAGADHGGPRSARSAVGPGQGPAAPQGHRALARGAAEAVHRAPAAGEAGGAADGRALLGARSEGTAAVEELSLGAARPVHHSHRHPQHGPGPAGERGVHLHAARKVIEHAPTGDMFVAPRASAGPPTTSRDATGSPHLSPIHGCGRGSGRIRCVEHGPGARRTVKYACAPGLAFALRIQHLHALASRIGDKCGLDPTGSAAERCSARYPACRCRRTMAWGLRLLSRIAARSRFSASAMSLCWQPGTSGSSERRCT